MAFTTAVSCSLVTKVLGSVSALESRQRIRQPAHVAANQNVNLLIDISGQNCSTRRVLLFGVLPSSLASSSLAESRRSYRTCLIRRIPPAAYLKSIRPGKAQNFALSKAPAWIPECLWHETIPFRPLHDARRRPLGRPRLLRTTHRRSCHHRPFRPRRDGETPRAD